MRGPVRAELIAVILAVSIGPVAAWAPGTRIRMVEDAVRLMPASLRIAFERQRETLLRGALAPMTDEDGPAHRPPWAGGSLDLTLAHEAEALEQALARPDSFAALARRFGLLAHYVADAGFPPTAGGDGDAARYAHFAGFCDSRRERFPIVFYGHDDPALGRGDWRAFALRVLGDGRRDDAELARAYAAAGDLPDPAAFDDRSVPFAVGSLAYSRTITDIVRAWLSAWERAGGDLGRTPYLESEGSVSEPRRP